jgi:dTDP-4-dehydrorhamnose reductase
MSILVFGKSGQVATELRQQAPDAVFVGRDEVDLSIPGAAAAYLQTVQPSAIINAAAYTAVDLAEQEPDLAYAVNALAVGEMADFAAHVQIPFVHISTDYVFDGSGDAPWAPDAPTGPLGVYGRTKLNGEELIRQSGCLHVILRTSWVFSAHGANFLKTMLRLSQTRDTLTIVADQIGGPTPAKAIAQACLICLQGLQADPTKSGTYHFSGAPDVSWADFAREIFTAAGRGVTVKDIPTSAYPTPAKRPGNSRLECSSLSQFDLKRPDWREATHSIIKALL